MALGNVVGSCFILFCFFSPSLSELQMPAPFTYLKERNLGQEEQTRQEKQKCENLLQGN